MTRKPDNNGADCDDNDQLLQDIREKKETLQHFNENRSKENYCFFQVTFTLFDENGKARIFVSQNA